MHRVSCGRKVDLVEPTRVALLAQMGWDLLQLLPLFSTKELESCNACGNPGCAADVPEANSVLCSQKWFRRTIPNVQRMIDAMDSVGQQLDLAAR